MLVLMWVQLSTGSNQLPAAGCMWLSMVEHWQAAAGCTCVTSAAFSCSCDQDRVAIIVAEDFTCVSLHACLLHLPPHSLNPFITLLPARCAHESSASGVSGPSIRSRAQLRLAGCHHAVRC